MFCRNCGEQVPDNEEQCPHCGTLISKSPQIKKARLSVSAKNRVAALFFCFLGIFGFAGIHRVYVGKYLSGLLYAATCGGFFIGTIWDLYKLLTEKFKDGEGYPLCANSAANSGYDRRELASESNEKLILSVIGCIALWIIIRILPYINN